MSPNDLSRLADAILDGSTVDWAALESGASDEEERASIRQLKVLAGVRGVHGSGAADELLPLPAPSAALPATWAHLAIVGRLGAGAFADVYRAWDPRLDLHVALKLLRDDRASGEQRASVVAEARLLAKVRHPNVVSVYGADRADGRVGVWMELIEGKRLDHVLAEQGALSAREAAAVGIDVCRALAAVHRAGVVHGDVKAQNVMRETGGRMVLMDFGAGLEDAPKTLRTEALAGTPLYLAPEVLAGHRATPQSDIYSLGVLLFHLVSRDYPVHGSTLGALRAAHATGERRHLRDVRPDAPPQYVAAIERALAVDPRERFQTAGALEAALASYAGAPRTKARRRWLVAGAGATAASLGLALALMLAPGGRSPLPPGGMQRAGGPEHPLPAPAPAGAPRTRKLDLPGDVMYSGGPSLDGKWFSYVDESGNLVLVDLVTGARRHVTAKGETLEHAEASLPSSDARLVAYQWVNLEGDYELRVVGADGKWPRVLVRSSGRNEPTPLAWSRDSRRLLCRVTHEATGNTELLLVAVDAGTSRSLQQFGRRGPAAAALSPDAKFVAYDLPSDDEATRRRVYVLDVEHRTVRALPGGPWNDTFPQWLSESALLVLSDRTGLTDAWLHPMANGVPAGEPRMVLRNLERSEPLALTPTGQLFYNLFVGGVDVYTSTLDALGPGHPSPPSRVPSRLSGYNISGSWSPDGSRLAFLTTIFSLAQSPGGRVLAVLDWATNEERRLAPLVSAGNALPRWSPDGRLLLIHGRDAQGRAGLFTVDVATGEARLVLAMPDPAFRPAIWSHDGRAVLHVDGRGIVSTPLTSRGEQVLVPQDALGDVEITRFGLSPDGRTVAFSAAPRPGSAARGMTLATVVPGEPARPIVSAAAEGPVGFQAWSPDGREVFFVRGHPAALWRVSANGGAPRPLGLLLPGAQVNMMSLHPDGRRVAFTQGSPKIELWCADGFLSPADGGQR